MISDNFRCSRLESNRPQVLAARHELWQGRCREHHGNVLKSFLVRAVPNVSNAYVRRT